MIVKFNNNKVKIRTKDFKFITFKLLSKILYFLNLKSNNEKYGIVIGSGKYEANSCVQIKAIETEIGKFIKWDDENTDSVRTISLDSDKSYNAIFDAKHITVKYNTNH